MAANKTSFKKGQSGNSVGRTKGTKNKAMTDAQILAYIGKREQHILKEIYELGLNDKNPNVRLKAFAAMFAEKDKAYQRISDEFKRGAADAGKGSSKAQPAKAYPAISLVSD